MNSGEVVHSFTRRAYSSSIACLVWPDTRLAARMVSAITRGSLIGTSVYDNPPRREMGNRHCLQEDKYGMRISAWMMAAALLCPVLALHAQDNSTYKVDFTIRDSGDAGGKTGRKYSLLVNRNQKTVFKVGNRVPVATGGASGNALVNTQFTYIDVG